MVAKIGTVRKICAPPPAFATPAIPIHQNSAAVKPKRMTSVVRLALGAAINDSRFPLTVTPPVKSLYFCYSSLHGSTLLTRDTFGASQRLRACCPVVKDWLRGVFLVLPSLQSASFLGR